jgi:hypothetical protein
VSLWLPPDGCRRPSDCSLGGGVLFLIGEVYYRTRGVEGMGMGDVKMLAMIGAFLGWPLMLLTLILPSFSGAIRRLAMMVSGRGWREGGAAVRHVSRVGRARLGRSPANRSSTGISASIDEAVRLRAPRTHRRWSRCSWES